MMKTFEDELGLPLLIKTKKGVEPTSEAKLLIPAMRAMAAQEERFLQEADEIRGIHRGSIRIGSYVSTSSTWLPQVIGYYRMLDPESYRSLGIGIRSIKEAGPLARSVISYIKDNIR